MTPSDRGIFETRLEEANRALISIERIGNGEPSASASETVHDALEVYFRLLSCRHLTTLSEIQRHELHSVADLLRARLQFFGEEV